VEVEEGIVGGGTVEEEVEVEGESILGFLEGGLEVGSCRFFASLTVEEIVGLEFEFEFGFEFEFVFVFGFEFRFVFRFVFELEFEVGSEEFKFVEINCRPVGLAVSNRKELEMCKIYFKTFVRFLSKFV
jgi:hypothetical protein